MARCLPVLVLLLASLPRASATPAGGSAELHELLDRLNTVGTVLMLGAHPDDENTAVMAYFARGRHFRTVYFSATRGEGGQNRIGTEQGHLMGVIRTHELLEARRIDGGEQDFATVVDLGYTKTPEEALSIWGEQTLLRDMVRSIRKIRPDVIVARFPPHPGSGGHGHHTAVGWTGPVAFEAAADPRRFPELGLPPWQAERYYFNVFTFGRRMEQQASQQPGRLRVELGEYDPVLGRSYAEIAGESRSMHRSQAMGASQRKGSVPTFFEYVAGSRASEDLFDGIDTTWGRVEGAAKAAKSLALARDSYRPDRPGETLAHLLEAYRELKPLGGPDVEYKRAELVRAIELAAGVWVDAASDRWDAVAGGDIEVTGSVLWRAPHAWRWTGTRLEGLVGADLGSAGDLERNRIAQRSASVKVPAHACYSQPYWLPERPQGNAQCADLGDSPGPKTVLRAVFSFETPAGIEVEIEKPVVYRWVDPSLGERTRPLAVVPPVTVAFARENRIFTDSEATHVAVRLASNRGPANATVALTAPGGWTVSPAQKEVRFERRGQEVTAQFKLTPPGSASGGELTATVTVDGRQIRSGMRTIEYGHIPATPVFPRAAMRVERLDIELLAREVGYVMGAGDKIPDALRELGANVTLLSAEDLAAGDLGRFDAVVTGVRALNTRPDLIAARERVLEYAENGGTLVVQYNTASFRRRGPGGAPTATLGPYPMTASRLRVTDEHAEVSFPAGAEHPLLSVPNRITAEDFKGWVQERGLYFMSDWDERYDAVLACSDEGENPLAGGMLYARYGKGAYVFTGYSWFRQLPAGVPGAFRIFANLISAGTAR
ncbi:MAG: hypothetical protein F4Y47_01070 [Acidobacteriia bacterium]|nr:hypothetical protein [Terriglobia bacterium]MYG00980.1 hypothetical protein [Terriglobia bacterium]MYK09906.1 hypothetical protein [Terriglobia bacterium]